MLSFKKLAIILVVLIAAVWIMASGKKPASQGSVLPAQQTYETKSDNQANVDIEVTPQTLGFNNQENVFEVKFDTHSVDLDFDFTKIMVLTDNLGNQYPALKWEGGSGGHHLTGKIVFPKLKSGAQKIILKISGIGGVERNFNWDLTKNNQQR